MARRKNPDTKTMLLIGGGALLVYLLFRKSTEDSNTGGGYGTDSPANQAAVFDRAVIVEIPQATVRQPLQDAALSAYGRLDTNAFAPAVSTQSDTFGVGAKTSSLSNSPSYTGSSSSNLSAGKNYNLGFM
jgi:hypothetical protein